MMEEGSFDRALFEERVESALRALRLDLTTGRSCLALACSVPHAYQDKFSLVEAVTNTAVLALLQALEFVGLTHDGLLKLKQFASTRAVVLQLCVEESCSFERKEDRETEAGSSFVVRGRYSCLASS